MLRLLVEDSVQACHVCVHIGAGPVDVVDEDHLLFHEIHHVVDVLPMACDQFLLFLWDDQDLLQPRNLTTSCKYNNLPDTRTNDGWTVLLLLHTYTQIYGGCYVQQNNVARAPVSMFLQDGGWIEIDESHQSHRAGTSCWRSSVSSCRNMLALIRLIVQKHWDGPHSSMHSVGRP